jgi:hypothetical protein
MQTSKPMPFDFLAASSFSRAVLFIGFVIIVSACIAVYVLAPRPLERLAQYRLPKVENIRFETLLYASIGDTPTHHQWFRGTLAFAVDPDWVYLRHSRFLRSPIIWRIPRGMVQYIITRIGTSSFIQRIDLLMPSSGQISSPLFAGRSARDNHEGTKGSQFGATV